MGTILSARAPYGVPMETVDLMGKLKDRLQQQQAAIIEKEGSTSQQIYRAELDTLWACVEVLAQLMDGKRDVIVPNWFAENRITIPNTVHVDLPDLPKSQSWPI